MTTASSAVSVPFGRNRLLQGLCVCFALVWIASGIRPVMVEDWWLENLLVILFVAALAATYRRLCLSDLSYLLIFVYLCMHEWGAHYRYAIDPVGEWFRHAMHTVRNDYDRVVHFAFGLLLAYPQREVLIRKARVGGQWALWIPVGLSLGFGAAYEIIEVAVAWTVGPDAGEAFLGLQGDPWDTHKDMLMALCGAALAMAVTAIAARLARPQPIPAGAATTVSRIEIPARAGRQR